MIGQHTVHPNPGSRKRSVSFGRGDGSGHGSYSGRGQKGQLARSGGGVRRGFEGGQTPLIRRMPKLKGFRNVSRVVYQPVNVENLNVFENGATIDLVTLFERGCISRKNMPVKILGGGKLEKKLIVKIDACSEPARKQIELLGGSITVLRIKKETAPSPEGK